ncbi:1333_t:CDS:2 [Acaulospora colombiana]|uniref:1333_t:CDS:1 n=1 Tax=Acaulospora colombiana TaxID=27376 RepID=A0ACA9KFV3_9GLOM|nr:1333_t:CDS:2 [Acaulospora colombiana]
MVQSFSANSHHRLRNQNMADAKAPNIIGVNKSTINSLFLSFRDSIDIHKGTYNQVLKRYYSIEQEIDIHRPQKPLKSILDEAQTKISEILESFRRISVELEEYIEAISFLEYLENGVLITKEGVEKQFKDADGNQFLQITYDDYLLGVADLTGELMRYAINCIGAGNHDQALKGLAAGRRFCDTSFTQMKKKLTVK